MELITKNDLNELRDEIVREIKLIINKEHYQNELEDPFEWIRSKKIKRLMDISSATLQNLRISGKIRYKKVMGSYYYNRTDFFNLFENEK
ncbi:DNA-binding protein [Chryseobacterium sp. T20]|uniref:DNA-binding protein n=1 Tax=Chryseobacterium sp. T20 TaxID=3395375 RepID=UPI0039BD30A4